MRITFRFNPEKAVETIAYILSATLLKDEDRQVLDEVVRQYGGEPVWKLVRKTHDLPEYRNTYVEGTSTTISFEAIASASGDPRRFRSDRTVISPETAAVPCPFIPGDDAAL